MGKQLCRICGGDRKLGVANVMAVDDAEQEYHWESLRHGMALEDIILGSKRSEKSTLCISIQPQPPPNPSTEANVLLQITTDAASLRLLFPHASSFV